MKRTKLAFLAIIAGIFFAALTQTSHAQLRQIELRVDGLACPFCAYGLEKNLKALKGTKELKIDMDKGVLTLFPKEEALIPIGRLSEVVKDSGFTLRDIKFTVAGHITTLAKLKENQETAKAVSEIQKVAKAQGIKLPDNPFVLKLEKPDQIFLLLKNPDKEYQKSFEQLSSIVNNHQTVVVTGTVPVPKTKKIDMMSMALFVESFNVEKSG